MLILRLVMLVLVITIGGDADMASGRKTRGKCGRPRDCFSFRVFLCAVAVSIAAFCSGAAAETASTGPSDAATTVGDVSVPAGVVYKPASQEANDAAREKLQWVFSFASPVEEITSLIGVTPTIVGAGLWSKMLQENPDVREKLKVPKVQLVVPKFDEEGNAEAMQQMEASVIRSSAEALRFWQELEKLLKKTADTETSPTVRKLTAKELSVYWTMIPFDIEEPVFIVEVGDHHILVNAPATQKCAIWIDDLKHVGLRDADNEGETTAAKILDGIPTDYVDPTTGRQMMANWEETKPQTGSANTGTSEGRARLDHIRLLSPASIIEKNVSVDDTIKIKNWVDECLEPLGEKLPAEHKLTVVVAFSADGNPVYRIASEPALPDVDSTKLKETLKQGPNVRSKQDEVEVSFVFLVGN